MVGKTRKRWGKVEGISGNEEKSKNGGQQVWIISYSEFFKFNKNF
jgi:hypothetical protein